MFASKCAKCGKHRVRWSLSISEKRECPNCGSNLAIHDEIVELDLDYEALFQSLDNHQEEWQKALEKTIAIYLNGKLPNVTSVN